MRLEQCATPSLQSTTTRQFVQTPDNLRKTSSKASLTTTINPQQIINSRLWHDSFLSYRSSPKSEPVFQVKTSKFTSGTNVSNKKYSLNQRLMTSCSCIGGENRKGPSFPIGLLKTKPQDIERHIKSQNTFYFPSHYSKLISAFANTKLSLDRKSKSSNVSVPFTPDLATSTHLTHKKRKSTNATPEKIHSLGHPSPRKNTKVLAEWLAEELASVTQTSKTEEECFELSHKVYDKVMETLSNAITEGCFERGMLLKKIWTDYGKMVKDNLDKAFSFAKLKDQQLTQIATNILEKYEKKVKANEEQFQDMRKLIEYYEAQLSRLRGKTEQLKQENTFLQIQQKGLLDDNSRLQREVSELKDINKAMRAYFSNPKTTPQSTDEVDKYVRDELIRIKLHAKKNLKGETTRKIEEDSESEGPASPVTRRKTYKQGTLNVSNAVFQTMSRKKTLRTFESGTSDDKNSNP